MAFDLLGWVKGVQSGGWVPQYSLPTQQTQKSLPQQQQTQQYPVSNVYKQAETASSVVQQNVPQQVQSATSEATKWLQGVQSGGWIPKTTAPTTQTPTYQYQTQKVLPTKQSIQDTSWIPKISTATTTNIIKEQVPEQYIPSSQGQQKQTPIDVSKAAGTAVDWLKGAASGGWLPQQTQAQVAVKTIATESPAVDTSKYKFTILPKDTLSSATKLTQEDFDIINAATPKTVKSEEWAQNLPVGVGSTLAFLDPKMIGVQAPSAAELINKAAPASSFKRDEKALWSAGNIPGFFAKDVTIKTDESGQQAVTESPSQFQKMRTGFVESTYGQVLPKADTISQEKWEKTAEAAHPILAISSAMGFKEPAKFVAGASKGIYAWGRENPDEVVSTVVSGYAAGKVFGGLTKVGEAGKAAALAEGTGKYAGVIKGYETAQKAFAPAFVATMGAGTAAESTSGFKEFNVEKVAPKFGESAFKTALTLGGMHYGSKSLAGTPKTESLATESAKMPTNVPQTAAKTDVFSDIFGERVSGTKTLAGTARLETTPVSVKPKQTITEKTIDRTVSEITGRQSTPSIQDLRSTISPQQKSMSVSEPYSISSGVFKTEFKRVPSSAMAEKPPVDIVDIATVKKTATSDMAKTYYKERGGLGTIEEPFKRPSTLIKETPVKETKVGYEKTTAKQAEIAARKGLNITDVSTTTRKAPSDFTRRYYSGGKGSTLSELSDLFPQKTAIPEPTPVAQTTSKTSQSPNVTGTESMSALSEYLGLEGSGKPVSTKVTSTESMTTLSEIFKTESAAPATGTTTPATTAVETAAVTTPSVYVSEGRSIGRSLLPAPEVVGPPPALVEVSAASKAKIASTATAAAKAETERYYGMEKSTTKPKEVIEPVPANKAVTTKARENPDILKLQKLARDSDKEWAIIADKNLNVIYIEPGVGMNVPLEAYIRGFNLAKQNGINEIYILHTHPAIKSEGNVQMRTRSASSKSREEGDMAVDAYLQAYGTSKFGVNVLGSGIVTGRGVTMYKPTAYTPENLPEIHRALVVERYKSQPAPESLRSYYQTVESARRKAESDLESVGAISRTFVRTPSGSRQSARPSTVFDVKGSVRQKRAVEGLYDFTKGVSSSVLGTQIKPSLKQPISSATTPKSLMAKSPRETTAADIAVDNYVNSLPQLKEGYIRLLHTVRGEAPNAVISSIKKKGLVYKNAIDQTTDIVGGPQNWKQGLKEKLTSEGGTVESHVGMGSHNVILDIPQGAYREWGASGIDMINPGESVPTPKYGTPRMPSSEPRVRSYPKVEDTSTFTADNYYTTGKESIVDIVNRNTILRAQESKKTGSSQAAPPPVRKRLDKNYQLQKEDYIGAGLVAGGVGLATAAYETASERAKKAKTMGRFGGKPTKTRRKLKTRSMDAYAGLSPDWADKKTPEPKSDYNTWGNVAFGAKPKVKKHKPETKKRKVKKVPYASVMDLWFGNEGKRNNKRKPNNKHAESILNKLYK